MNNVAMNIFVCVLGEYIYAFLLGIFLELRFLGHRYINIEIETHLFIVLVNIAITVVEILKDNLGVNRE